MINKIPDAIKKLPQTNVFGKSMRIALSKVNPPNIITPVLLKLHFPNISSISGLLEVIAQPCFIPIYIAKRIRIELTTFKVVSMIELIWWLFECIGLGNGKLKSLFKIIYSLLNIHSEIVKILTICLTVGKMGFLNKRNY